ncbi:MAG: DUF6768 family protein [Planctomycetota bacterium]|jgi:hypothetical protein
MDDIERELRKVLKANSDFDAGKAKARRKEIEQMILQKYEFDMFKVKVVFWIFFVLCLGMMAGGYIGLRSASDTKAMLSWVIFFMIGFNSTILMKLWYWVVDARFKVLKEVKQLQLQVAELTGNGTSSED